MRCIFRSCMNSANLKQIQVLNELAGLVESVSSTVSFHPQALICEIRSSPQVLWWHRQHS
jgi:hypothetical protein